MTAAWVLRFEPEHFMISTERQSSEENYALSLVVYTEKGVFIMSRNNSERKSCKDVFNAFLVRFATYAGIFEFPCIKATYDVPNKVIAFSKAISCRDYDQWIHFYEDDYLFERLWRNPCKYLEIIKKYKGVILPDFSLYRDMPFVMQLWNIYRSRAIGHWLQTNGVKIIPNVRFGDSRTYNYCCDGIEKHGVIAVGTYGNLKYIEDREIFIKGLDVVVRRIIPLVIVIYGAAPEKYFKKYQEAGIQLVRFDSEFATSHKEVA